MEDDEDEFNIESIQELGLDRDPNDPITRFKEPANCTNIDYRGKCSLKSHDLIRLQELSSEIDDIVELGAIACALLIMIQEKDEMEYGLDNIDSQLLDLDSSSSFSGMDISSKSGNESCIDSDSDIEIENIFEKTDPEQMNIYFSGGDIFEGVRKELSLDDDLSYSSIILVFSLIIGCAAKDLHQFLLTVVEISTIRESEWNAVESSLKKPKTNRTIDDFNESDI